MDKPIVFLSHSSKDSKLLNRLKTGLEVKTHGTIDFFLSSDGESIPFGRNWVASIQEALNSAKLAFVFLSTHSVGSGWVHFESGFMYSKGIDVVPVGIPPLDLTRVPPPLSLLQGFNLHSHESLNNIFVKLNKVFETKHTDLFSTEDYQHIFTTGGLAGQGLFGMNEGFVERVNISFDSPVPFIPILKDSLNGRGAEAIVHTNNETYGSQTTEVLTTYGLNAYLSLKEVRVHLTPELAELMFAAIDEAIDKIAQPVELRLYITFTNLKAHNENRFRGKLLGTPIKIQDSLFFTFKGLTFHLNLASLSSQSAALNCTIKGKLTDSNIQELVALLIEIGAFYEELDIPMEMYKNW